MRKTDSARRNKYPGFVLALRCGSLRSPALRPRTKRFLRFSHQFTERMLHQPQFVRGLKGTMSEAELHVLKQRLHQGKLSKARRGELASAVPIGYVRQANGEITLD